MSPDPRFRPLESLLRQHLDNSIACGQELKRLFGHLDAPQAHIAEIRRMEEFGDRLTAEAHRALEDPPYSELIHLTQLWVKHLDDIIDGLNNTARVIDIFTPERAEPDAQRILAIILEMAARLSVEVWRYPGNNLDGVRDCREALKRWEEEADTIYHEWRKSHRRHSSLSLISELDWTEILGLLEATTDACYHSAVLLERITRHHLRQAAS